MSEAHAPQHRLRKMRGRDPHESHRVATSLELLFDLTYVIAFGQAGNAAAHLLAHGHLAPALIGFGVATFGICWAWINFTWFASAYDTDDWLYRLLTMLQMVGVLVFAAGLPRMFQALDTAWVFDNQLMVIGYVIMRIALVLQWLRAARHDPDHRDTCQRYAVGTTVVQIGWVISTLAPLPLWADMVAVGLLGAMELSVPYVAERHKSTPWHPHHVAERYGLMAIIVLGECLIGTIAVISATVSTQGWSLDAALVGLAGTLLTFGLWWVYGLLPSGEVLHHARERSFVWGYGHIPLFGAIAAVGAGLHVAANYITHEAHVSRVLTVLFVVGPVMLFQSMLGGMFVALLGFRHMAKGPWLATYACYAAAIGMAAFGVRMAVCLLVVAVSPLFVIVHDELAGAHRRAAKLRELAARHGDGVAGHG